MVDELEQGLTEANEKIRDITDELATEKQRVKIESRAVARGLKRSKAAAAKRLQEQALKLIIDGQVRRAKLPSNPEPAPNLPLTVASTAALTSPPLPQEAQTSVKTNPPGKIESSDMPVEHVSAGICISQEAKSGRGARIGTPMATIARASTTVPLRRGPNRENKSPSLATAEAQLGGKQGLSVVDAALDVAESSTIEAMEIANARAARAVTQHTKRRPKPQRRRQQQ